jgi:polyhydroxybutyrate depolymerase
MTNMKKALLVSVISLVFLIQGISQQNYLDTIVSDGIMRTFRVYVPAIYDGQTARPLVFQFHGTDGTQSNAATAFETFTKFKSVADTANFILVTPNGLVDPDPFFSQFGQTWSTWFCCLTVDDPKFVSDMIDKLEDEYNIDSMRVYATGYSAGGLMSYELACQLDNRIAAIGSVAGLMVNSRIESCNASRAVPILEIHGTNDANLPYAGMINGIDTLIGVDSVLHFWTLHDQCTPTPTSTNLPNTNTTDGSSVTKYVWPNCAGGSSVELYKVINGGHTWPGRAGANTNRDIIADQEIWRFFLKHKLDEPSAAIENQAFSQFSVFPNPTSEILHVSFDENQNFYGQASMMIADLYGRIVASKELARDGLGKNITFNLNEVPAGGYFLILDAGVQGRAFQRFVVLR